MKTFFDLIQEVQKPGLCHHCGGCVTFCTAINYGALELAPDGMPRYKEKDKCIECGLCYAICPVINEFEDETKRHVSWSAPIGRVLKLTLARAKDRKILAKATDGGVVTSLLLHLLNKGRIDGAIVSKQVGLFKRQPWLAQSREEIIEAAGFNFDTSHGMTMFSDVYSTFSPSIVKLGEVVKQRLKRIAFVGTPCQINTLRRMEVLGIVPSDSIQYYLGLFCTGNFLFGEEQRQQLEKLADFSAYNSPVDFAGRIIYDENGVEVFNVGKHKGKPVETVFRDDPSYYSWMMNGDFPLYTKKILTEIKLRSFGKGQL